MSEFYDDGLHKCERCDVIFKTLFNDELIEVEFCPKCGAALCDIVTEEEIESIEG